MPAAWPRSRATRRAPPCYEAKTYQRLPCGVRTIRNGELAGAPDAATAFAVCTERMPPGTAGTTNVVVNTPSPFACAVATRTVRPLPVTANTGTDWLRW